ncbi:MAG: GIY-YIG nuclease family protein [Alphaproteobacteria bacterium]|nr:GIY-YIG nuclease family protein [Alphaproteobacteria bacterium]
MIYVYILESQSNPDTYYISLTDDLERRLNEHNSGKSIHTNKFKPWSFKNIFGFKDRLKAESFENYLKSHSGRAFTKKHF